MSKSPVNVVCAVAIVCAHDVFSPATTIAQAPPPAGKTTSGFPASLRPYKLERAGQVFNATWQFINTNYVDPRFNGLDWSAIRTEYEPKVREVRTLPEFYQLMEEMVARLDDGHSTFLPPKQASALQDYRSGTGKASVTGLAATLRKMPDQSLLVLQVIPDSLTAAVLTAGDRITAIDGVALNQEDRTWLLYGREGAVRLTVQSTGNEPRDVQIRREKYTTAQMSPPVFATRLNGDIGYLAIYDFLSFTTVNRAHEALLHMLRGGRLNGLIVDVRANDGGIIGQMVSVLGLFINGGSAGSYVNRTGQSVDYTIPQQMTLRALEGVPMAVLTGPSTNSSGDIFAAVMQTNGRAKIVGMPTPGNVEMLQAVQMPGESVLWVAVANYRDPNGKLLEGRGVQPERIVDVPWWRFALQDDPQVQAAVDEITR